MKFNYRYKIMPSDLWQFHMYYAYSSYLCIINIICTISSIVLIFVDVDDFKHYNDKYGHMNGDIVLKTFAKCLSEQFSSIGYINEIAKKLSNVELEGFGMVKTSFSAGAASYPVDGVSYDELCNAADEALYEVKESGKGKFYWYR